MGRNLITLGALLLLLTVTLWIGDAAGWFPNGADDAWSPRILKAGLLLFAAGLLLRLAYPVSHQIHRSRCVVCGHPVEKGHTYCHDHLQETVNTYRDRTRDGVLRRPRAGA